MKEILDCFEKEFDAQLTQWAKKGNDDYLSHWIIWHQYFPREVNMADKLNILKMPELWEIVRRLLKKHNAYLVKRFTTDGIWFEDGTDDQPKRVRM